MKHYTIEQLSPGLSTSTRVLQIKYLLKYGIIKKEGKLYRHKEGHTIEIPFGKNIIKALRKKKK